MENALATGRKALRFIIDNTGKSAENHRLDLRKQSTPIIGRKIFIVHGHDDATREAVARIVSKLQLEPVILHEQANKGATVIEKFEKHADVGFAIILITPDDEGRAKGERDFSDRARQNVVLEMGYFIGKLGRDRVMVLLKGKVEQPSDVIGVVYETLDDKGAWHFALGKELRAAGYDVDLNKLL